MIGWLQMGTIGFGRFAVTGRNRDPSPPAITTAFMDLLSHVHQLEWRRWEQRRRVS
jgi:hypothetical protein